MTHTRAPLRKITILLATATLLATLATPAAAQTDSPGLLAPGNPLHRADLALEQTNELIVGTIYGPTARADRSLTHAEERISEMNQLAPRNPAAAATAATLYTDKIQQTQRFMEQNRIRDPALHNRTNTTLRRAQERLREHLASDQFPEQARPALRNALNHVNRSMDERGIRRGPPTERPGAPDTTPETEPPRGQPPTDRGRPGNATTTTTPTNETTTDTPTNTTPGNATPNNTTPQNTTTTPPTNETTPGNTTATPLPNNATETPTPTDEDQKNSTTP